MNQTETISALQQGRFDAVLQQLYACSPAEVAPYRERLIGAVKAFGQEFGTDGEISLFSAPGRTELCGNHTDHQGGHVLTGAVDLDIIAVAARRDNGKIRLKSEGFLMDSVELSDLRPQVDEEGTSAALLRGIAAKFDEMGYPVGGFDAYISSDIAAGSGLSSSAAFEVLIAYIIDRLFNEGKSSPFELARICRRAENVYYGKASGLMDQTVSASGGFVSVDFSAPDEPSIDRISFDFADAGYSLCITDTGEDHSAAAQEYSAVAAEMKSIAAALGKEYLAECSEEEFYEKLPELRKSCGDRSVLRAAHFFADSRRAELEAEALSVGDTIEFFRLVNESGASSCELLQNIYSCGEPGKQGLSIALMMSRRFLGENGAVRVHGGGFGGSILSFVPNYLAEEHCAEMERIFGAGSCRLLNIRPVGAYELEI